jgi:hypothetical protein
MFKTCFISRLYTILNTLYSTIYCIQTTDISSCTIDDIFNPCTVHLDVWSWWLWLWSCVIVVVVVVVCGHGHVVVARLDVLSMC